MSLTRKIKSQWKLYVWEDVATVSDHYHSDGGIVVLARTLKEARQVLKDAYPDAKIKRTEKPLIMPLADITAPLAWVFPNAGCC